MKKDNKKAENKEKGYLCSKCKEFHYKNSEYYDKHKDFQFFGKYWCVKCSRFHFSGKVYKEHSLYMLNLTTQQLWKLQFDKSWKNYSIKSHKKTYGSLKQ